MDMISQGCSTSPMVEAHSHTEQTSTIRTRMIYHRNHQKSYGKNFLEWVVLAFKKMSGISTVHSARHSFLLGIRIRISQTHK